MTRRRAQQQIQLWNDLAGSVLGDKQHYCLQFSHDGWRKSERSRYIQNHENHVLIMFGHQMQNSKASHVLVQFNSMFQRSYAKATNPKHQCWLQNLLWISIFFSTTSRKQWNNGMLVIYILQVKSWMDVDDQSSLLGIDNHHCASIYHALNLDTYCTCRAIACISGSCI